MPAAIAAAATPIAPHGSDFFFARRDGSPPANGFASVNGAVGRGVRGGVRWASLRTVSVTARAGAVGGGGGGAGAAHGSADGAANGFGRASATAVTPLFRAGGLAVAATAAAGT